MITVIQFQDHTVEVQDKKKVDDVIKKVDDVMSVTDRTSLLVVAALCAAEQDLKHSGSLHDSRDLETSPTGRSLVLASSAVTLKQWVTSVKK